MSKLYLIILSFFFVQSAFAQGVIYVNEAATGSNNGTNWTDAYIDLQDAIQDATYGDQIWVAQGEYQPTSTTDREIYFELENGVQWYGGFLGNETDLEDRNFYQNETILSGDIGVVGDSLDNSYTVVYSENADENTLIEGFTIERGNANNEADVDFDDLTKSGGGMYVVSIDGGDVRCQILHNNFQNNTGHFGGGLYVESKVSSSIRSTVFACNFYENQASNGGGFYWRGGTDLENEIVFDSLSFNQNIAIHGGALGISASLTSALFIVRNSSFLENSSTNLAIASSILYFETSTDIEGIEIRNNHFELNEGRAFRFVSLAPFKYVGIFDNFIGYNEGGVLIEGFVNNPNEENELKVENNIFEWNSASEGAGLNVEVFGGANINLKDNSFTYNGADFSGGGFLCRNSDATVRLNNNYFKGNSAQDGVGGGARIDTDDLIVANCIFDANIGKTGAGLRINNGTVLNSVFYKNNALQQGGAIRCTSPTIANCIFKENVNFGIGPNIFNNSWPLTVSSCLFDAADCEGINYDNSNITCDANTIFDSGVQFTNPEAIDFSLSACSPAIDAGENSFLDILEDEFDYYGNDRIQGESVDMGVAEFMGMTLLAELGNVGDCASDSINNGSLSYTVENACLPLTILLNDTEIILEELSGSIDGLSGGDYDVTITDAIGRSLNQTVNIAFAPLPEIDQSINSPSCSNYTNGFINTSLSGELSPFSIVWEDESTSLNRYNLAGGLYQYSITDSHGCLTLGDAEMIRPDTLKFNETIQNLTCTGGDSGAIFLNTTGGTGEYSFNWNPNPNEETGQELTNISAGSYIVTVTDENNCSLIGQFVVQNSIEIETIADIQNPACANDSNASISLETTGGNGDYSYQWSPNANGEEGAILSNIASGTYMVTVSDSGDCEEVFEYTIENPAFFGINAETTNLLCAENSTGSINILPIGGVGELTYNWSPNPNNQEGANLSDLPAGMYTVLVTDGNNCEAEGEFTIESPSVIELGAAVENTLCTNDATGSISINGIGGTGDLSYTWSPNPNNETGSILTNISAGTYNVIATDENNCEHSEAYEIENAPAITLEATIENTSCFGTETGAITGIPSGGTGEFSYNWFPNNNNETSATLSEIPSGTYVLTVLDENNCEHSEEFLVEDALPIILEAEITSTSCNGGATGAISVTATNGTTAFEYAWSNGGMGAEINNLEAGVYVVTATDTNNCIVEESFIVEDANALSFESQITNNPCFGDELGTIVLNIEGNTEGIEFLWSENVGEQEGTEVTNLAAGDYSLTVVDAIGCESLRAYEITEAAEIVFESDIQHVLCAAGNDGAISITALGGTPFEDGSYLYDWSPNPNGSEGNVLTGLSAGIFGLTIEDANGCQLITEEEVLEPTEIVASVEMTPATCHGFEDGSAIITVAGGTPPYMYSENLENLGAGSYSVSVTDSAGCVVFVDFIITEPAALNLDFDIVLATTSMTNDGAIYINDITGGTAEYEYQWEMGETMANLINIPAGTYNLTITDAADCSYPFGFEVEYLTSTNSLSNNGFQVELYPNLILEQEEILMQVESIYNQNVTCQIIDKLGRVIKKRELRVIEGANHFTLNTSDFVSGVYFVHLKLENGTTGILRIIIQ